MCVSVCLSKLLWLLLLFLPAAGLLFRDERGEGKTGSHVEGDGQEGSYKKTN